MSWFRSGFLVLFATYGYKFSMDPAMNIVKRQLRTPERRRIYSFTIDIPEAGPWSKWRILELSEPKCTGVLFGTYVVLFPHAGDVTFYERLETHIGSRPSSEPTKTTAQSFELAVPGEPLFGYDLEDSSGAPGETSADKQPSKRDEGM